VAQNFICCLALSPAATYSANYSAFPLFETLSQCIANLDLALILSSSFLHLLSAGIISMYYHTQHSTIPLNTLALLSGDTTTVPYYQGNVLTYRVIDTILHLPGLSD
jgi:hypothetical protein